MIKLSYTRLLVLICFCMSIATFLSCEKEEGPGSDTIELLSFGPTGASHGDTLQIIGNNLQWVNSVELTGATVNKADFKQHSSELILLIIPAATEKGNITLKTDAGDIVSKTQLNLGVTIKVNTMTAQARPGENITLTGDYLNWVNSITFNQDKTTSTFVSKTINQLVVTVPLDAQTGPLIISYTGTDSAKLETKDTLKVTLPLITGFAPNPVKHQTDLTITGTNLDLAKKLLFTNVSTPVTTFVSQTATQIVVKVPAAAKTGKVTTEAASGVKAASTPDLTVLLPAVTSIAPNPIAPLSDLTITGTNLDLVTGVSFTGITNAVTSFVSQSPTQIVVTVPTGTLKGKVTLSVLNSTLTVESSDALDILGGLPPLADFAYAIYTDGVQNGFQDWSWATRDFNSTQIVRQGSTSIKATYGVNNYEGITFHNDGGPATDAYTKLEFSIYGTPGTGGKVMNVVINGAWGSTIPVTIVEGAWTTYSLNISSLPSPNPLKEVILQSAGWNGVVHIDHVGLR